MKCKLSKIKRTPNRALRKLLRTNGLCPPTCRNAKCTLELYSALGWSRIFSATVKSFPLNSSLELGYPNNYANGDSLRESFTTKARRRVCRNLILRKPGQTVDRAFVNRVMFASLAFSKPRTLEAVKQNGQRIGGNYVKKAFIEHLNSISSGPALGIYGWHHGF